MFAVTCLWCNFGDFKLASYLHTLSSFLFGLILFKVQMVNISQKKVLWIRYVNKNFITTQVLVFYVR